MAGTAGRGNRVVLGVDLGTSGCKVCAVTADGRFLYATSAAYPTHHPAPNWAEQDPADWLLAVAEATRALLAEGHVTPSSVAGLALSTAAHVGVLLDAAGRPLRRAILWSDQRSCEEVARLEAAAGPEIFRRTHQKVSTTWTLPHLVWIRRREPDTWRRVRRVVLSKDFVIEWLTGRAVSDPATALASQLFDPATNRWSEPLCALADVRPAMLPEVAEATTVAGGLTHPAASALGLPAGTPVVIGTLDSAAETCGAGATRPGQCVVRLATAGGVHVVLAAPRPHPQLITYPHPVRPLWYCQAGTSACASAVRWAMDTLGGGRAVSFTDWDALAASVPRGAEGLVFHPYLAGERCPHWDATLRASFIGLTARHRRGHFARAVYEGTALSIRDALSVVEAFGLADEPFVVVGGGARSGIWTRILADVLNRPLETAAEADSSYGAALIGLVGLGLAGDLAAVARGRRARRLDPDPAGVDFYRRLFGIYRRLHRQLAPEYHALAAQGDG